MERIGLLDSTLGVSGELLGWAFGEDTIYRLRPLLQKSELDIIELGLLTRYTKGPHFAIYTSSELPPAMERRSGQRYAMLLGENRPDLSALPDRSERTVDILRVLLTPKRMEEELKYCAGLQEKGYQVAVLVTETARYAEAELHELLRQIGATHIWACFIYDKSGVMDEEELRRVFSCFDRLLPAGVHIGFHGGDNLWLASELAQALCLQETDRKLLLDVSAGGLNCGALQLKAEKFAHWMNQTFMTHYSVPVLEHCRDFLLPHLTSKEAGNMRLLYRTAAEFRCAYRYPEYLCELDIPPADQMGVLEEITEEDAFDFTNRAANRALIRYRKKRLNMVLVIPTANRWKAVDSLLFSSVRDLLRFGIDIVIYDSSDDERTHAVTANFQLEGYENVFYERYTGGFDGSLDEKVMTAFRRYHTYDYIWVNRDGNVPMISSFYYELLSVMDSGAEWIIVDASFRNQDRHCIKKYENCVDVCKENLMRTNTLGLCIFKNTAIEQILLHQPLNDSNYNFYIPFAPMHQIAQQFMNVVLIIADVYRYNPYGSPKSFWSKDVITMWGKRWHDLVLALPTIYDGIKTQLMKIGTSDFHPFHVKPLLGLRSENLFNVRIYKQHKELLAEISDTPPWKFYFAALVPKPLAKLLLKMVERAEAKPEARLSKIHRRLFDIYVRLGR